MLILVMLAAILLPLLSGGQPVYAGNNYYNISSYIINVEIKPDGSADFEERLTYSYSGNFNGALRDVDFDLTGGLDNAKVFVEKDGSPVEWKLNSTSSLDDNGGPGTYNLVKENNIAHFKIFEPSGNEEKTFIIKYTFKDAITKYNDIAEFNRKIIDANWPVALNNIEINFTLPEGAQRDEIKVFGHGPLTGNSKIIDARHVQFTIEYLPSGNMVETLVLFPTRLVPQSTMLVPKDKLPEIMANEKQLADEANKQREAAKQQVAEYENRQQELEKQRQAEVARIAVMKPYGNAIGLLFFLLWFVIIIYIYIKYDKELKHNFEGKYYRELPGKYTPAEMSSLLSMGSVGTRDITATLMDLVRKEQLQLISNKYIKKGIFKDKEVTDYAVSLKENAPAVSLKSHEAFLIDWFIRKIGNGSSLLLDEISDYAKTKSGARRFKQDYDNWCGLAKEEAEKNDFFDETCKAGKVAGILISLAYLGLGIFILSVFSAEMGAALIIQFLILLIFSARLSRRTAYGNEQNAMWLAFKNFLKDFSHMDKAEMPSIVIWEHYLVYAISLGVAKEVISQLPLVFNDTDLQDTRLTYMYGYNFANFAMFTNAFDRTVDSVDGAISNAMAVANSTLSSSSGGGGGFSGGSSGGGGGGGGGGAF